MKGTFVILVLGSLWIRQDDFKKQKRISDLVDLMECADKDIRKAAYQELLQLGREAVPYLEQRVSERGMGVLFQLMRDIDRLSLGDEGGVDAKELPTDEEMGANAKKLSLEMVEKYVFSKYYEAWSEARRGNYDRGYALTRAILALEPSSRYAPKMKAVQRYCDHMMTQTTLLKSTVVSRKNVYLLGETAEMTLQIRNIFKNALSLEYDPEGKGIAFVELLIQAFDPLGTVTESTAQQELLFSNKVDLDRDKLWKTGFEIKTDFLFPESDFVRFFTIRAWTQPVRIEAGGTTLYKRISFEPIILKVVPKKYAGFVENPLEWLGKNMDSGNVNEVFVCLMLLDDERRPAGVEFLVNALKKVREQKRKIGEGLICTWLERLTGLKYGGNVGKWLEWHGRQKWGEKK